MKRLALLALVPVLAFASRDSRDARDSRDSRGGSGAALRLLANGTTGYDSVTGALYTASGVPVTFARSSTKLCDDPAASPRMRTVGVNVPCVTSVGMSMEPSGTNSLLQSEALDVAPWGSLGTGSVTANTWDFGTGAASGETLTDSDATNRYERNQTIATTTAGAWTASCYFQAGTLTAGALALTVTGGTGTATCNFSGLTSTTSRQSCTATVGAGVTGISLAVRVGSVGSDTGSIKVGGCQLETGPVATSDIPTTGTAATRAAETATVPTPASLSRTEGCACATVTPLWTGANPSAANGNIIATDSGSATPLYAPNGQSNIRAWNGTSATFGTGNYVAGTKKRYCTRWSASASAYRTDNLTDGVVGSNVAFSGFASFSTIGIGSGTTGSQQLGGSLSDIVLGTSPGSCQ